MKKNLFLFICFFYFASQAKEGIWLPSLLQQYNIKEMSDMGCQLSAQQIYDINQACLKDAIVKIDGQYSGAFISPDGLLMTSYTAAYSDIAQLTTPARYYIDSGFWAMNRQEELYTHKRVEVLLYMKDITAEVLKTTEKLSGEKLQRKIAQNKAKILKNNLRKEKNTQAQIETLFYGKSYYLFVSRIYKDIRIVGVPRQNIAHFGKWNAFWNYPNYSCDFALYRVYAASDGSSNNYSLHNKPFTPRSYLSIAEEGIEENDFAMVMSFPKEINRMMTSFEIESQMNTVYRGLYTIYDKRLYGLESYINKGTVKYLQYASDFYYSILTWKNASQQINSMYKNQTLDLKRQSEESFKNWTMWNKNREAEYAHLLDVIRDYYKKNTTLWLIKFYLEEMFFKGNKLLPIVRQVIEMPNSKRIQAMQETLSLYDDIDQDLEIRLLSDLTHIFTHVPDSLAQPSFLMAAGEHLNQNTKEEITQTWGKKIIGSSIFGNKKNFTQFLYKPDLSLLAQDSLVVLYQRLKSLQKTVDDKLKVGKNEFLQAKKRWIEGMKLAGLDTVAYPEANGSLRVSYGKVEGFSSDDGLYKMSHTTTKGIIDNVASGKKNYSVSSTILQAIKQQKYGKYADKNGMLRTCFIISADADNGSMGAPVLNTRGQLTGIVMFPPWESLASHYKYNPNQQRCIVTDIRYILWYVSQTDGKYLINEMKIGE